MIALHVLANVEVSVSFATALDAPPVEVEYVAVVVLGRSVLVIALVVGL